jgi:hypothetical protein
VDLRVNSAAGPARPISQTVVCEIPGQRNFAVNFDTPPDVAAISGVQLTVQPAHRVRGAVLYQRKLGLASEDGRMAAPRIATPLASPIAPSPASPLAPTPSPESKPAGGPPVIKLRKPDKP